MPANGDDTYSQSVSLASSYPDHKARKKPKRRVGQMEGKEAGGGHPTCQVWRKLALPDSSNVARALDCEVLLPERRRVQLHAHFGRAHIPFCWQTVDMPWPSPIGAVPEELLLLLFSYLDSPAPSTLKSRQEPNLDLTSSSTATHYKSISLVSRLWRRIVLPPLFRHSRLVLSAPDQSWPSCPVCGPDRHARSAGIARSDESDTYHAALFDEADLENAHIDYDTGTRSGSTASLQWAARFYHTLKDYLAFVQCNQLAAKVQSFVLLTDKMMEERCRFPHQLASTHDYRYLASAAFWQHLLLEVPTLSRVALVAPPSDLACLANCAIDLFGDWAFGDMEFHILELSMANNNAFSLVPTSIDLSTLQAVPSEYPAVARSSILNLRPWTHVALNEGSFLKAYGTYEYFERGPPSLIYSIRECLASNVRNFMPNRPSGLGLSCIRSFTYTAIFPFANHVDFRGLLPFIEELDVQLAPDPRSGILDDKNRVGKAELEDCWSELLSSYRFITRPFRTFDIRPDGNPKLKRFVCRDMRTPTLQRELDDECESKSRSS